MKKIPHINAVGGSSNYTRGDSGNDLFPRNQDPDTRTAKQWLKQFEAKTGTKWYPKKNTKKPVICVETGVKYRSLGEAEQKLRIWNLYKHIKGDPAHKTVKGLTFRYL